MKRGPRIKRLGKLANTRVVVRLEPGWHTHGCVRCGRRYTDGSFCDTPMEDGTCLGCRSDHGRPSWDLFNDPIECCRSASVQATNVQRINFGLAGTNDWYICQVCQRQSPFNPGTVVDRDVLESKREEMS